MVKTIAVSDDMYRRLKKARMPGESFSAAIKRRLEAKPKLSTIIGSGTLTREDWNETRKILEKSERSKLAFLGRYSKHPKDPRDSKSRS
ncbi:MAG TPA: antitoxin VapB family protein [Nitrososphaerales archaeon]|nr:antitoxin VapB family protein [Nitrososphaerales archaeon]